MIANMAAVSRRRQSWPTHVDVARHFRSFGAHLIVHVGPENLETINEVYLTPSFIRHITDSWTSQ